MAFNEWSQERLYEWRELLEVARETRGEAIWLTGREKHSGEPLSAIYSGMTRSVDCLVDRLFIEHTARSEANGLSLWTLLQRIQAADSSVDLVIAELP
jgi:hypothetical protein